MEPSQADVQRAIQIWFLEREGVPLEDLRRLSDLALSELEDTFGLTGNYDNLIYRMTPEQLRELFQRIVPNEREQDIFAVNYGLNPRLFDQWLAGELQSNAIPSSIRSFLRSHNYSGVNRSQGVLDLINTFDFNVYNVLLCDGDDLRRAVVPLLAFAPPSAFSSEAMVIDHQGWQGAVNSQVFYRASGIPIYVSFLKELYKSPVGLVRGYTDQRDATKVDLSVVTSSLLSNPSYYDEPKTLTVVSSRFGELHDVARAFTERYGRFTESGDQEFFSDAINPLYNNRGNWYLVIQDYLDPDDDYLEASPWFIRYLQQNRTIPVAERYQELADLVGGATDWQDLANWIMPRYEELPDPYQIGDQSFHQIRGPNSTESYLRYQAYLVLIGVKYMTSVELLAAIRLTAPRVIQLITDGAATDGEREVDGQQYRISISNPENLRQVSYMEPPTWIRALYQRDTWADLLSLRSIRVALGLIEYSQSNELITSVQFINYLE